MLYYLTLSALAAALQCYARDLTVFAIVVDVLAILPTPHDVGLGVARCLASKCHVGRFAYHHIRARLPVHNTGGNCNRS